MVPEAAGFPAVSSAAFRPPLSKRTMDTPRARSENIALPAPIGLYALGERSLLRASRDGAHGPARRSLALDRTRTTATDAASLSADAASVSADARESKGWARIVWDFSRPHTIIGSVLSVVSLHFFAAMAPGAAVMNLSALGVALAWATVCAILVNIYLTGLNQITDVDIDKINKPYLPIAAGHLSLPAAWAICLGSLFLGVVPSMFFYPFEKAPLLAVTIGSALLGTGALRTHVLTSPVHASVLEIVCLCQSLHDTDDTHDTRNVQTCAAYSLPPMRLKRYPIFAALCIIVVRGTLVNLGFYAHAAQALGGAILPARAWLASLFFGLFGWSLPPSLEDARSRGFAGLGLMWTGVSVTARVNSEGILLLGWIVPHCTVRRIIQWSSVELAWLMPVLRWFGYVTKIMSSYALTL
jgi:4-hydroxybenzoate polyprenyltransferase